MPYPEGLRAKLETHRPGIAALLDRAGDGTRTGLEGARSGDATMWTISGTARHYLHSRFDPRKEAKRSLAEFASGDFTVLLGLGAGHHLAELLDAGRAATIAVVEPNAELLRCALADGKVRAMLSDDRVIPLFCMEAGNAAVAVARAYAPFLDDSVALVPILARTALDAGYFRELTEGVRSMIEEHGADVATQSRFGLAWFRNAVRNAADAVLRPNDPESVREKISGAISGRNAIVVAAGPSIDGFADEIAARAEDCPVIACDTSVPWLLEKGIVPSLAVSIDCQQASMHHYLHRPLGRIPLLADLSLSPSARRAARSDAILYAASRHPFHILMGGRFACFGSIDATGGNVAHAACSAAFAFGAEGATLYGADFSYPSGASYARGTYLHRHFAKTATRLDGLESRFFAFPHRSSSAWREKSDASGAYRYRTPLLDAYRGRLERGFGADVMRSRDGSGVEKRFSGPLADRSATAGRLARYPTRAELRSFLSEVSDLIASDRIVRDPRREALGLVEGLVQNTLLVCARDICRRGANQGEGSSGSAGPGRMGAPSVGEMAGAFEDARRFCLEEIDKAMRALSDGRID